MFKNSDLINCYSAVFSDRNNLSGRKNHLTSEFSMNFDLSCCLYLPTYNSFITAIRDWQIGIIVVLAVYILLDLIALIGTTKSSRWPLIGWIVLEFIRIFSMMICTIIAIIIWAVYMDDSKDTSYMIAVAVIGMMLISMLFNQGRRKV